MRSPWRNVSGAFVAPRSLFYLGVYLLIGVSSPRLACDDDGAFGARLHRTVLHAAVQPEAEDEFRARCDLRERLRPIEGHARAPKGWTPSTPLEKATDALMRKLDFPNTGKPLDIAGTNPNYKKGKEWQINCQRCVPAYEARLRGYDVTAKPCDGNCNGVRFFKVSARNEIRVCRGGSRFKKDADEIVSSSPGGSRFLVRIKWANGRSAHFFTARNEGGKIIYENPQNPSSNAEEFFPMLGAAGARIGSCA